MSPNINDDFRIVNFFVNAYPWGFGVFLGIRFPIIYGLPISLPDTMRRLDVLPRVISTQKYNDVTCTMCAYNNWMQVEVFESFERWTNTLKQCWLYGPGSKRTPAVQKLMLQNLIGSKGISGDLLMLYLGVKESTFYQVKKELIREITSGFIFLQIDHNIIHVVCVKDGYLIDSIYGQPYLWTGIVFGYTSPVQIIKGYQYFNDFVDHEDSYEEDEFRGIGPDYINQKWAREMGLDHLVVGISPCEVTSSCEQSSENLKQYMYECDYQIGGPVETHGLDVGEDDSWRESDMEC